MITLTILSILIIVGAIILLSVVASFGFIVLDIVIGILPFYMIYRLVKWWRCK